MTYENVNTRVAHSLLQDALAALNCRFILNRWAVQHNPQRPYAQEELQSLIARQVALQAWQVDDLRTLVKL